MSDNRGICPTRHRCFSLLLCLARLCVARDSHDPLLHALHSWGNRRANGYQALAVDGYLILAERLRTPEERAVVRSVLERVMRVTLDIDAVYAADTASAQALLQQRLIEDTTHEFAVRSPSLSARPSALLSSALFCTRARACVVRRPRKRCEPTGPNQPCGDLRKKTKQKSQSLIRASATHTRTPAGPWLWPVTSVYHANTEQHFAEQPYQTKICTEATRSGPAPHSPPLCAPADPLDIACLQTAAGFISWTPSLQRLYCLVSRCVAAGEPVLLIGETGAGKTTVCQLLSLLQHQPLSILNCHAYTETADFLGGYRPTPAAQRSAGAPAFEWMDGPLLSTMRQGSMFLVDELSLAEDGVLERLNSALEPSRTITLAERAGGPAGSADVETITAAPGWRLLATMNPGGDFGKRELSPALRNRFTEIWVPSALQREDLLHLVTPRLKGRAALLPLGDALVDFWCVSSPPSPRSRLSSLGGVVYDDHIAGRFSNHSQARTR